jgi:hypothetical protein
MTKKNGANTSLETYTWLHEKMGQQIKLQKCGRPVNFFVAALHHSINSMCCVWQGK